MKTKTAIGKVRSNSPAEKPATELCVTLNRDEIMALQSAMGITCRYTYGVENFEPEFSNIEAKLNNALRIMNQGAQVDDEVKGG